MDFTPNQAEQLHSGDGLKFLGLDPRFQFQALDIPNVEARSAATIVTIERGAVAEWVRFPPRL